MIVVLSLSIMVVMVSFSYHDSTMCQCICTFLSKPHESVMTTSEETVVEDMIATESKIDAIESVVELINQEVIRKEN